MTVALNPDTNAIVLVATRSHVDAGEIVDSLGYIDRGYTRIMSWDTYEYFYG